MFSLSQSALPAFEIGLDALSKILDKADAHAAAKKIDPSVLFNWRLAPDMLPLVKQVQIVTDQVKNGSSRLANVTPPPFPDDETTIAQLKARLDETKAYLKTLDRAAIDASVEREIVFPLGPTKKGHMKGADYLTLFVLPNFYFHLTTAYDILRICGVELGKPDFVGQIPMTLS